MFKNKLIVGFLFIVLLCCAGAVSAVDFNNTIDLGTDVDSNEFILVSEGEQVDDVDESVLSAPNENNNFSVTADDEILSVSDEDFLGVTSQETNQYLNDIKTSTSDEFYKFVDYLIKQKGFKFNAKTSDDGYVIYSNSQYSCKLYDGENYVLTAGTQYFVSKNRMGYVIDEYYPDILYSQNKNIYVDELYLGWLKNVENYHPSLNIVGTNTPIYISSVDSSSQFSSSDLPASFDLRDDDGKNYVTSVKDQAQTDNCWIFASIAALESFLLKSEGKSYDFSTKYDFSENNLKNVMSNIGKQGIYSRSVNSGGNDNMALAYFIRWSGPILEEYDKYDLIGRNTVNNIPLEFFNSEKHVQGVKYIHARNDAKDNDEIKRAIRDYGAVATSLLWNSKFNYGSNYYCYNANLANPEEDGHAICIIGWDDSYKKTNFGSVTPPKDGAFLIKNSWGDRAGDKGYYWVSYYDATLAKRPMTECDDCVGVVFTSVEDKTNYGKNYNYNPQGVTYWMDMINTNTNKSATTVSYYSQWVASDDDNLKACGVYVNNVCECSIKVFVDGVLKGTTNNVPLSYEGFHTIQLSNMVPVKKGQKFRIEVTINSKNSVRLPFELSWRDFNENNPNRYDNAHANSDESGFISGGLLVDITNFYKSCNICMNVYTEYKKLLDTKIDVSIISFNNNGVIKDITVKLSDLNNIALKNFELISYKGSNYQSLTTNNYGEATFTAVINGDIVDMCIHYLGSERYNYVFKELTINKPSPNIQSQSISISNTPQPTVNLPVSNPIIIPTTPITKYTIVTNVKISGMKSGATYDYKAKIALTLSSKVSMTVKIIGNSKSVSFEFTNGKTSLDLSKYSLKKNNRYSFKFSGSYTAGNKKYDVTQSAISIRTKK